MTAEEIHKRLKRLERDGKLVLSTLRSFNGIHVAGEQHASIPQRDDTIYFRAERAPDFGKWFAYE